MEKESQAAYLDWLENAYKEAYKNGEIELEDYRQYEEEVYEGRKDLFSDYLSDIEHQIAALERTDGNERAIINYYNQMIADINTALADARRRGLSDDDEYVQELTEQKWDYMDAIKDIQDELTENAKDAVKDLVDYRIDMLKQDLENEKDALSDKLSALKDFYDEELQLEMYASVAEIHIADMSGVTNALMMLRSTATYKAHIRTIFIVLTSKCL